MDEKLQEYFEKGVRLVWFVRPKSRVVDVYTAPDHFTRLTASMQLDGGDVLPGFSVQVGELFRDAEATRRRQWRAEEKRPATREEERPCAVVEGGCALLLPRPPGSPHRSCPRRRPSIAW